MSIIITGKTPAHDLVFGCDGGENAKTNTPYQKPPFGPLPNSKIGANIANIRMYDNFATVNTQLLHIMITNHSELENHLWRLYIKVNGIIHDFMLDISDMPELEDITDNKDI